MIPKDRHTPPPWRSTLPTEYDDRKDPPDDVPILVEGDGHEEQPNASVVFLPAAPIAPSTTASVTEWPPRRSRQRKKPVVTGFRWLRGQDLNL
jgi:hypothetical protein